MSSPVVKRFELDVMGNRLVIQFTGMMGRQQKAGKLAAMQVVSLNERGSVSKSRFAVSTTGGSQA